MIKPKNNNTLLTRKESHDIKEEKVSFKKCVEYYKKTKVDPSFQRRGGWEGGSGWSVLKHQKYLDYGYCNCCSIPSYSNVITLVDVRQCLQECYSKDHIREYKESISYFESILNEGYEFISLDGNNSSSTVVNFIQGIDPDELTLSDGRCFNDLDEDDRQEYLRGKFNYHFIRNMNLEQMCEYFISINEGEQLNPQEKRQAKSTKLSKFIRETANNFMPANNNGFSPDNYYYNLVFSKKESLEARKHEEILATISYFIYHNFSKDVSELALNNMYKNIYQFEQDTEDKITYIHSELRKVGQATGKRKNQIKIPKLMIFGVFLLKLKETGFKVKDHGKLFDKFLTKDAKWVLDSVEMKKDKPAEFYEKNAWDYWCTHFRVHQNFNSCINKVQEWFEQEEQNLIDEDVILKFRKNEIFSFKDKLIAHSLQNGKDRNGNEIEISDLYNGEVHADHVISVKDGGKTEISNCELMYSEDNLKKGAKSNEPYFEHQIKETNETDKAAQ